LSKLALVLIARVFRKRSLVVLLVAC
jgi:hypothetical protein